MRPSATVLRLHTVVPREVAATETAVLSVGMLRAGTKENVIPDSAELGLTVRSYTPGVRDRVLAGIERTVRGEAAASGAAGAIRSGESTNVGDILLGGVPTSCVMCQLPTCQCQAD